MKFTLLEMCQEILSSMDSDEVNSISDTTEAMQVAMIVRRAYLDIVSRLNLPEHFDFFKLEPSLDPLLPIVMYRPDNVDQLVWLKYDRRLADTDPPHFQDIKFLEPSMFMDRMFMSNTTESTIGTGNLEVDGEDFALMWRNNKAPNYWTSLDDHTLIFDSYDIAVDDTLKKSKTHCYGLLNTSFTLEDTYTPNLDNQQFSLLFNDAKAIAWAEIKQASHQRAERESKRQLIQAQKNKRAIPGSHAYADYNRIIGFGRK